MIVNQCSPSPSTYCLQTVFVESQSLFGLARVLCSTDSHSRSHIRAGHPIITVDSCTIDRGRRARMIRGLEYFCTIRVTANSGKPVGRYSRQEIKLCCSEARRCPHRTHSRSLWYLRAKILATLMAKSTLKFSDDRMLSIYRASLSRPDFETYKSVGRQSDLENWIVVCWDPMYGYMYFSE